MAFQVIRVEKLKSAARLAMRVKHAMRDHVPGNADPSRLGDDRYSVPGVAPGMLEGFENGRRSNLVMDRWRQKMPEKHRKDAVVALEFLVAGSKEGMAKLSKEEQTEYFKRAGNWIAKRFGGSDNILGMSIHFDETTPHASVFIIPKHEGRLSAKHFLDGPKDLAKLQTDFNEDISKRFGFERGREKSRAVHTSIKEFYSLGAELMRKKQQRLEDDRRARIDGTTSSGGSVFVATDIKGNGDYRFESGAGMTVFTTETDAKAFCMNDRNHRAYAELRRDELKGYIKVQGGQPQTIEAALVPGGGRRKPDDEPYIRPEGNIPTTWSWFRKGDSLGLGEDDGRSL